MKKLISLIKRFEKINNITINVIIFSDESYVVEEFWKSFELNSGNNMKELETYLNTKNINVLEDFTEIEEEIQQLIKKLI